MGAGKGSLYEMKSANSKKNAETEKTKTVTAILPPSERQTNLPKAYDRITDRAHIIEMGTESYRFKRTVAAKKRAKDL
jgi:hypothetical protein